MMSVFKLISSDWKRYIALHGREIPFFLFLAIILHNPGMVFSVLYRIEYYLYNSNNTILRLLGYFFYPFYYSISYFIYDFDIPPSIHFGKGLYIHNRGITMTNNVKFGDYVSIMGPATIGMRGLKSKDLKVPTIGNNVTIYAGARIFGGITIGNNVEVGANAVVGKSFPSNVVIAGVPAKIVKRTK